MSLILENISGALLAVNDLGFSLELGTSIDLSFEADPAVVSKSAVDGDLFALVNSGSIIMKDPIDGVTNLSAADSLLLCQAHNESHYHMPIRARIADAVDVNIAGLGSDGVLAWNGSEFAATTPSELAGNISGDIDHTSILNIGTNSHSQIDTHIANSVIHSTVDDLTDLSDVIISSPSTGDILEYNGSEFVNVAASGGPDSDLSSVTLGTTTNTAIATSYANINWQTTHLENDSAVLEHDNSNNQRVLIKESGLYLLFYSISFDADSGEEQIDARILVNDTTTVPGSGRTASEDDEINDLSNSFTAELTANTYVTLQVQASGAGNVFNASSNMSITRARGTKGTPGAKGDAGSGSSISIAQDGNAVAGGPYDTINFIGDVAAVNAGSNQIDVTVTAPSTVFGSEFALAESVSVSTTTSTNFSQKVSLSTGSIPAGKYRVGFGYSWNYDSTGSSFRADFRLNGSGLGEEHRQEPQDSSGSFGSTGTSQKVPSQKTFYVDLAAGTHTLSFHWRASTGGVESSVWESLIEFWRVT